MFAWLRRKPAPPSREKLRVVEALEGYPPYVPPMWNSDTQTLEDAYKIYSSYFLNNREQRVDALRSFLAKFDVALSLEDEGIKAVSAWFPVYGDLLVEGLQHPEDETIWTAYHWFQSPWTGALVGLNPIFDLGVYMGECMLQRNKRLKWHPYINPEPNRGALHPIHRQTGGFSFDPMKWTYTECKNTHSRRMSDTTSFYKDSFYRNIKARADG